MGGAAESFAPSRATAVFDAPHGPEALQLSDGETAPFGRASDCRIRFAYAPEPDLVVHGVAGRFLVAGERVVVEAAANAKPLTVVPNVGPRSLVGVDEAFSPRARKFEVLVPGANATAWRLRVAVRSDVVVERLAGPDPKSFTPTLEFGERDWDLLRAYAEPMLTGGLAPQTHDNVAARLNLSRTVVRRRVYDLWADLFEAGIVMPDVNDKHLAAVQGLLLYGYLGRG